MASEGQLLEVLSPYKGSDETQLSIETGWRIKLITPDSGTGWAFGEHEGKRGWFPSGFARPATAHTTTLPFVASRGAASPASRGGAAAAAGGGRGGGALPAVRPLPAAIRPSSSLDSKAPLPPPLVQPGAAATATATAMLIPPPLLSASGSSGALNDTVRKARSATEMGPRLSLPPPAVLATASPAPLLLPKPVPASLPAPIRSVSSESLASTLPPSRATASSSSSSSSSASSSAALLPGMSMSLSLNTGTASAMQSPALDREELFQAGPLIHSVSMAEFHLTKGTNLAATYPPDVTFKNAEELANICFPEGAHLHHHDWVFIFLWDEGPLYGVAFYSRFEDTSITRGALQKSLLVLARKPYFHMFLKVLNFGLQWHFAKFMMNLPEGDNACVLKTVFDSFNDAAVATDASSDLFKFSAFNSSFQFSRIPLRYDTFFPGASLLDLVKLLKDKTLLLWKSLLLRHRILFSGAQSPANLVGNCCLAAPQMILPLAGYSRTICPYVSITDIAILHSPSYICGMTNPLFESKPALWDTLISFTNKKPFTFPPTLKLSGRDQKFTKVLLHGIENEGRDDDWLRAQFKAYTREFLQRVEEDTAGKEFATFKYQPLYVTYREALRIRRKNTLSLALSERPDPEMLLQKHILTSEDLPAEFKSAAGSKKVRKLGRKK